VLTMFAAHMGPAEVATWALLDPVWEILESATEGIGDAAEIRVAVHLGNNRPYMARLSSYKSLALGMCMSLFTSAVFFTYRDKIPGLFTHDPAMLQMLSELIPFITVGNISMTFGVLCWSLIGAQGRFKLATWINVITSWIIGMPFAAFLTYYMNMDLQGLTASLVVTYVLMGACLSVVLLCSDWRHRAWKIQRRNRKAVTTDYAAEDPPSPFDEEQEDEAEEQGEEFYVRVASRSGAPKKAIARKNMYVINVPEGAAGIYLGDLRRKAGTVVTKVNALALQDTVHRGDQLRFIDGVDVATWTAEEISEFMSMSRSRERAITLVSNHNRFVDEDEALKLLKGVKGTAMI